MDKKEQRLIDDGRELWKFLHKEGDFVKQKNLPFAGTKVRKICNYFAGHFVSNTDRGYKVTVLATDDEIEHSINDLRSRCKKMLRRADALDRVLFERRQGRL